MSFKTSVFVPRRVLFAVCLMAAAVGGVHGQRYPVHAYTEQDGLPSSTVYDLVQDEQGFIWVATRNGVSRYDGSRWHTWSQADGPAGPAVEHLALDSRGRIWAASATHPDRVSWFEGGRWHPAESEGAHADGAMSGEVFDLLIASRAGRDVVVVVTDASGILVHDQQAWSRPWPELDIGPVRCAAADGSRLLLGTESGVALIDLDDVAPPRPVPELAGRTVDGLTPRRGAPGWWVAGDDWVGKWSGGELELLVEDFDLRGHPMFVSSTMIADPLDGLWIATAYVVHHVSSDGKIQPFGLQQGLSGEGAHDLFVDRQHNLWVAGARGLNRIPHRYLVTWSRSDGLLNDEVSAVLELGDGSYLLGHPGGVTHLRGPGQATHWSVPGDASRTRVMDLEPAPRGGAWIATSIGGLWLRASDGTTRPVRYGSGPSLAEVTSVLATRDGTLWIGGKYGLLRGTEGNFERVGLPPIGTEHGPYVRRIVPARGGRILVATSSAGLYVVDGQEIARYGAAPGHRHNNVYTAIEHEGDLLVGTSQGLFRAVADGGLVPVGPPEYPAIRRPVYFLSGDAHSHLWIGTDNGAVRWDGAAERRIGPQNGLPGSETNRDAGYADSRGRFWIGTNLGVAVYTPRLDVRPDALPRVGFDQLEVEGEAFPVEREASVTAKRASLVARFHALTFIDERNARVQTWLEGLEPDWQPPRRMAKPEVRYLSVPPGTYRLHVRVLDAYGRQGPEAVTAPIVIEPEFWLTGWFRALVAGLGVLAFAALLVIVLQRRSAAHLEEAVHHRTRALEQSRRLAAEKRARLATILGSAADGIIALDEHGVVVLANAAAERLLGRGRLEGRPLAEVLHVPHDGDAEQSAELVQALANARYHSRMTGTFSIETGRLGRREVEASLAPIAGESDDARGAVLAFRDVTERRRMEEEVARAHKLESLGLLAGGIAHDFNNLLTVLLGNLSLLEIDERLSPETRELVADMTGATRTAQGLAQQLLTFARGGAPVRGHVHTAEFITNTCSFTLSGSEVKAELHLGQELPALHVDVAQVSQALGNMLINASQAMGERGKIRVEARLLPQGAREGLEDAPAVCVDIADDGPGIPDEVVDTLFDPYVTTRDSGNGLGLAIAHSVARRHGGRLSLLHARGGGPLRGACFRLVLPAGELSASPAPSSEPSSAPEEAGAAPGRTSRLLVIEDEDAIRMLLGRILEGAGYEVHAEPEGGAAVAAFRQAREAGRPFDLVISDLTIADGMGGLEALEAMRAVDPGIRAIVASGYSQDPVMASPRDYGFLRAVVKPFSNREIREVVAACLRESGICNSVK